MTNLKQLDDLVDWFRNRVAPKRTYKVPPGEDEAETAGYEYKLAHPAVYALTTPMTDTGFFGQLDQDGNIVQVAPSIIIQLLEGYDTSIAEGGTDGVNKIRIVFQIWNPGLHTADGFARNNDGWRDLYNLMETAHAEIKKARILNGHYVVDGLLRYKPASFEGAPLDLYPYYQGEMTFEVKCPRIYLPDILSQP